MDEVNYKSQIVMGEEYVDEQSGFQGIATAIYFYQFGCARVNVEAYDKSRKEIRSLTFDAPRLTHVKSKKRVTVKETGGPGNGLEARDDSGAMR